MDGIQAWGLEVIRALQGGKSPTVTLFMEGVTFFGSAPFMALAILFLYWAVDRKRTVRLALIIIASEFVNLWLKQLFDLPRPFEIDASVGLLSEIGHGLPSGHAQGSTVFWGLAAVFFPKPWNFVVAIVMPLLVGISRVYLGVHFPTDVIAGWAIGLVFVAFGYLATDRIEKLLAFLGHRWRFIALAFVAFLMNALYRTDVSMAGLFLGAGAGFIWAGDKAAFDAGGPLLQRLARFIVGAAAAGGIYYLFRLIMPAEGAEFFTLARFFTAAILGFWVAFGAPWLFLRLNLAKPE